MRFFAAIIAFLSAMSAFPVLADGEYELPRYKLLYKQGDFEIREYAPQIVAEVAVTGDRSGAANRGFRMLADYIFGENAGGQKISMTSPVTQLMDESVGDAETMQVQQEESENTWLIRFKMPEGLSLKNLPKPDNAAIRLHTVPGSTTASVTFSGFWTDGNLNEHAAELHRFVMQRKLEITGSPYYAFYNSPFTLPWNRRNEVIVTLTPETATKLASH